MFLPYENLSSCFIKYLRPISSILGLAVKARLEYRLTVGARSAKRALRYYVPQHQHSHSAPLIPRNVSVRRRTDRIRVSKKEVPKSRLP